MQAIASTPLAAFGAASAVWTAGYLIVSPRPLVAAVLAYLTVGTLAVGSLGPRLIVFVVLWEAAVCLMFPAVVLAGPPSLGVFSALWISVVFGSLAFIGWVATGSALLEFLRDM
ncbi:MAG TPA: hypothetical protein VJ782_02755 [Aeromicrobium sp.]|nr:hypothetical protein [Aeromicrobium sp.]